VSGLIVLISLNQLFEIDYQADPLKKKARRFHSLLRPILAFHIAFLGRYT